MHLIFSSVTPLFSHAVDELELNVARNKFFGCNKKMLFLTVLIYVHRLLSLNCVYIFKE